MANNDYKSQTTHWHVHLSQKTNHTHRFPITLTAVKKVYLQFYTLTNSNKLLVLLKQKASSGLAAQSESEDKQCEGQEFYSDWTILSVVHR